MTFETLKTTSSRLKGTSHGPTIKIFPHVITLSANDNYDAFYDINTNYVAKLLRHKKATFVFNIRQLQATEFST
jgi:hypothetical protein